MQLKPQSQTQTLALGKQPDVTAAVNFDDIDMQALIDEWKLSKHFVEQYTRDFMHLDSIVDGVPINHNPDVPFVGDTTLAGLVRNIPKNSLQQLPVFSAIVNGTKNSIPALLCTFLLKKYIFNEDTFGKGLLSTLQIGTEQALTHGYAPFMAATGTMYQDFGTTLRLLHFSDTAPEPGISDANESGYHYVVANLVPSAVKKILRAAQNNPNTTWNVDALQRVLTSPPKPKEYGIWESPARRNQAGEAAGATYQFVSRYETGPDSTIITFCTDVDDAPLRVMNNKSKFGYPRVMYLVVDPAPLTPFGISRVRLASPMQNLSNIYLGNIAALLILNSAPPIMKRGKFLKPVQLKQNAVWETTDTQADAKLVNLDNGSLEFYPQMAQQIAGQIQNIMGGQTMTINAGSKASSFSKTGPGVKQSQGFMDVDTNQFTKLLENFLRQYSLVGLDTLLSEQEGIDNLIVDDDTKNAINQIEPNYVGDDNTVEVTWQDFYAAIHDWSVEVTVSVSKDQLKDEQRADLQDTLTVLAQMAPSLGPSAVEKVEELTNLLLQDNVPNVKPMTLGLPTPQDATGAPALPPQ